MNLADWLRRSSRPALAEQLALVAALAQAVEDGHAAAHQYAGWSPARVKIRTDGGVDLSAVDIDQHADIDLAYSAPESAEGREHTPRSDVYSAGVLLYEILTGAHPFGGASVLQPRGAAKPLSEVRRDLPQDLADAVTACLERDPNWRPTDLSFVLQVSREAAAKAGAKAAVPAAAPALARRTTSARRDSPMPSLGGGRPPSAPTSRMPLIVAGLVIVIAAGIAFVTLRSSGTPPVSVPTPPTAAPATAAPSVSAAPSAAPTTGKSLAPVTKPPITASPSPIDHRDTAAPVTTAAPATAPPVVAATAAPATPAPVVSTTAPPTAVVVASTAPPATPPPAVASDPVLLKSISPLKVRRGFNALLDVHGDNLRAEDQVAVTKVKGHSEPGEIMVLRKKLEDPTLLKILVNVAANASTGLYAVVIQDPQGRASNPLTFEITQ